MKFIVVMVLASASVGCALDVNGTGPEVSSVAPIIGDAGRSEPLPDARTVIHLEDAACNRLTSQTYPSLCTDLSSEGNPTARYTATYYSAKADPSKAGFICNLVGAPLECSGCDYTCACFQRAVGPMAHCSCSQDAPGAYVAMVCP